MSEDVATLLAEDAQEVALPSDSQLGAIRRLAEEKVRLLKMMREKEGELYELEVRYDRISQVELPRAMENAGMSEFTLTDGTTFEVDVEYYAGITDEKRPLAHAWLRSTNNGDLIKNVISVPLSPGQDIMAARVAEFLKSLKLDYEQKETVHGSTLKAFVKKRMADGKPVDKDLLGIHVVTSAGIKGDKTKRKYKKEKRSGN